MINGEEDDRAIAKIRLKETLFQLLLLRGAIVSRSVRNVPKTT